jgi:hypothetical protein
MGVWGGLFFARHLHLLVLQTGRKICRRQLSGTAFDFSFPVQNRVPPSIFLTSQKKKNHDYFHFPFFFWDDHIEALTERFH